MGYIRRKESRMKKIAVLLGFVLLSTNCCLAKSLEYKLELGRLKNAKSAEYKVLNVQIDALSQKVTNLVNDTTVSEEKKQELIELYVSEIRTLKDQKLMVNYTYKKSKKDLKKRY